MVNALKYLRDNYSPSRSDRTLRKRRSRETLQGVARCCYQMLIISLVTMGPAAAAVAKYNHNQIAIAHLCLVWSRRSLCMWAYSNWQKPIVTIALLIPVILAFYIDAPGFSILLLFALDCFKSLRCHSIVDVLILYIPCGTLDFRGSRYLLWPVWLSFCRMNNIKWKSRKYSNWGHNE
jgi:hypothetical protein